MSNIFLFFNILLFFNVFVGLYSILFSVLLSTRWLLQTGKCWLRLYVTTGPEINDIVYRLARPCSVDEDYSWVKSCKVAWE